MKIAKHEKNISGKYCGLMLITVLFVLNLHNTGMVI